jgi:hypothetical protein
MDHTHTGDKWEIFGWKDEDNDRINGEGNAKNKRLWKTQK